MRKVLLDRPRTVLASPKVVVRWRIAGCHFSQVVLTWHHGGSIALRLQIDCKQALLRPIAFVFGSDGQNWEMKLPIGGPKNDDRII